MVRFLEIISDNSFKNITEIVELIGEGEYNLNVLKEIKVTDDFLGLDLDVRQCQNEEPLINCTTRKHLKTMLEECGCLPFNIRLFHKVHSFIKHKRYLNVFQETLCTSPQELECVKNVEVDTSSCLKPCSGLIVTSFYKSELKKDLETLFPIFGEYNNYKKVTTYPSVVDGMLACI